MNCRGLTFMSKFLAMFLENEKKGNCDENLCDVMTVAYKETLAAHHGWFVRRLFGVSAIPTELVNFI